MKTAIAAILALLVAGCASGPYYAGYSGGYGWYEPNVTYDYGLPYYSYYGYPVVIGGTYYYDRHDGYRDGWRGRGRDRDDDRARSRDRDDDGQRRLNRENRDNRPRGGLDTRHGEAGNEAGM